MKKHLAYIMVVIFSVVFLVLGNKLATSNMPEFEERQNDTCEKAEVVNIEKRASAMENMEDVPYCQGVNIFFTAKFLSGENSGQTVTAIQNSDPENPAQMKEIKTGDKVLLAPNINDGSPIGWLMREYVRTDVLLILGGVLCALIIVFGKIKGLNTIISLAFTCISIFSILVPAILSGKNIYIWSIMVCCFIIVMTLVLVNGINKKCFCATLGCIAGVFTAGVFTIVADRLLHLTGMVDNDSLYLLLISETNPIDLRAIIFAGILIGAVGAIMDVSTSLSSSLFEIAEKSSDNTFISLLRSGINIGRDIMGTMANTLVLAYIGGSLSLTLLLIAYSSSMLSLFNREMIVVEILQALAGSFGILLTIPLTSIISAAFYSNKKHSEKKELVH